MLLANAVGSTRQHMEKWRSEEGMREGVSLVLDCQRARGSRSGNPGCLRDMLGLSQAASGKESGGDVGSAEPASHEQSRTGPRAYAGQPKAD